MHPSTLHNGTEPPARDLSTEPYPADYTADFRRLAHALLEKAWLIILCLLLCLGAGFAYLRHKPVLYSSTATILVEQQERILKVEDLQLQDFQALDFLQTVVQSLKSRAMLERVAETNKLAADPRFTAGSQKPFSHGSLLKALDQMVTVKLRRGTRLIDITVTHRVPALTAEIANSLVRQYINEAAERHLSSVVVANDFLSHEAERLRKKLQDSENALQRYKEDTKSLSLDDRQNTVVAGLKELSSKVTEAKSTRIKAETAYQQVLDLQPNVKALLALPVVAADPTVINLQANLAKAENDFAALRQRYKEKHPKYVQAQSQINAIQSDLTNAIRNSAATLKTALDSARAAESALNDAFRAQEASALELNKLAIQYGVLNREVDSDRALYESILNRMKETSITKELKHSLIRLTQPAFIPEQPLPAKRGIILALSGMAGLFFGAMLALGLQSLDSSIKTIDHAESLLRLPVLSAISHMREVRRGKSPLVVLEASNSIGAEAFRTLRTTLSMLSRVEECRVFLLTSALPQEGKTFCSLNYAASLAQLGLNTLLIDADLRRPAVESSLLGKRSSCPGVADYLLGQKRLDEIVQPTSLEKFLFIPAGTTAPNPAELLAKDGLSTLINEALKHYDRVVIDSAPIHAVSDTLLMLKNVQTVCLVVRAARTSSRSVLRCVQILQGAQAPLCGIVLNRMPVRRGLSPDNCYYDYSYHGKYSKSGIYGAKS